MNVLAIEDSWTATFIGESPLKGLQIHVAEQLSPSLAVYGRYCSIVQSSGMGKSRLLDEFSKYFFLIPVNLRSAGSRGLFISPLYSQPATSILQAILLPTMPCVTSSRIRLATRKAL